jgi:glucose/arabinose dehydrogenase
VLGRFQPTSKGKTIYRMVSAESTFLLLAITTSSLLRLPPSSGGRVTEQGRAMRYMEALVILAALASPVAAQGTLGPSPTLSPPNATPSAVNFSTVVGWPEGKTPTVPEGFEVAKYAGGLDYPRWLHVLPNGDVLVSEARTRMKEGGDPETTRGLIASRAMGTSADRITLLRDADRDGVPETRSVLLDKLNQPFGMALLGNQLYVATTDAVLRYEYREGMTRMEGEGRKILALPAGGYNNHWTRNIVASPDGTRLYITVGSASNAGEYGPEEEERRAAILELAPDGSGQRIVASGLRNPNGLDFEPTTGAMWAAVNERDGLGDELVPDYITSLREGAFYGWPYSYYGQHEDPRLQDQRPDLVAKAVVPDYAVGAHVAALGFTFYDGEAFPEPYRGGAFVSRHGSWNRAAFSGYDVIFVPFANGRPSGPPQPFLAGFIRDEAKKEVHGRPCGLAVLADGSLLVADDAGDTVWRVRAQER